MKCTVRHIAEQAGVSPATVSRVLNGTGAVSREKRELVSRLLEEAGSYAPRRRRKSPGGAVGVLLLPGSESDPHIVLKKLNTAVRRLPRKWDLLLLSPEILPAELSARHLRNDLAGLLLLGHRVPGPDFEEALRRIPHVWLNSYHINGGEASVLMGNEFAGRIAARHLCSLKCRRIAFLDIPSANPGFRARLDGFRFELFARNDFCKSIRLSLAEGEKMETCNAEHLEQAFLRKGILEKLKSFDGIFSPEDRLTAFLHRALRTGKVRRFPALVSCNRTEEYLAGLYPRPASIDLGAETGAELGLEELFRRISGEKKQSDDVAVIAAPRLVEGD